MAYKVGVSTGWWRIAKQQDLFGLAQKIAYGLTTGVNFVQVDLETTSEFLEPGLSEQVKHIRDSLGMEVGLHAEIGEVMALESAELRYWEQSHRRLCETVKHAVELKMSMINLHLSTRVQILYLEAQYRIQGYFYPVVSFDGKPLYTIADESPDAKEFAKSAVGRIADLIQRELRGEINEVMRAIEEKWKVEAEKMIADQMSRPEWPRLPPEYQNNIKQGIYADIKRKLDEEVRQKTETLDAIYGFWKKAPYARYLLENSEIGAYQMVAAYMRAKNDPLWNKICGGDVIEAYRDKHAAFNAAVAARYIEGHLRVKGNKWNKALLKGMSVLEFCEKNKIYLTFEVPEANEGQEGLYRLFDPRDSYHFVKKMGSKYVKLTIDFEHMLAQKVEPDKIIDELPDDAGSLVLLFHVGRPIPYFGTSHGTIPLGSQAQEYIYRWIWKMRKKGFMDGYIIYERGAGQTPLEVFRDSVLALRQIAEWLEKDVEPDELPPEFYGLSEQNEFTYKRQWVAIRDNAWTPLAGLLMIPEETHTFLGSAAVQKGKAEEWKKGKYR